MIIAIDFDGTCVTHEFPKVGTYIGAEPVLRDLVAAGHKLILFTMRSDGMEDGTNPLAEAVNWFKERGIPLFGVNTNPEQSSWTSSPKAYAKLYIDDAALGAPLTDNRFLSDRPFIDWHSVRYMLERAGVLPSEKYLSDDFSTAAAGPQGAQAAKALRPAEVETVGAGISATQGEISFQ